MSWSKPFTVAEIEYIKNNFPRMSALEIAEQLGRTKRGVNAKISALGLRDADGERCARASFPAEQPREGSRIDALKELRDMQRSALAACSAASMAKLSAEYRETLSQIEAIENPDTSNGGDELGELLGLVALRTS